MLLSLDMDSNHILLCCEKLINFDKGDDELDGVERRTSLVLVGLGRREVAARSGALSDLVGGLVVWAEDEEVDQVWWWEDGSMVSANGRVLVWFCSCLFKVVCWDGGELVSKSSCTWEKYTSEMLLLFCGWVLVKAGVKIEEGESEQEKEDREAEDVWEKFVGSNSLRISSMSSMFKS